LIGLFSKSTEAFADNVAQSLRHLGFDDWIRCWRVSTVLMRDCAGLHQVAQQFLNEKWIAFGPFVDCSGAIQRHGMAAERNVHAVDFVDAETAQPNPEEIAGSVQVGQCRRQRMDTIDFHVAVGSDDQEARVPECACKMQQQIERIPVRVVKVFQHQQQRLVDRGPPQEASDGLQQAPAIVRRVTQRAWRDIDALAHLRYQTDDLRSVGAECDTHIASVGLDDIATQRLHEWHVRQRS
jgi:hypothetical protein